MHRGAALCTWTNAHRPDASEPSIIVPCKKRRPGALTAVDHTSSNEWRHTLSSTKATSRLVASSKMHPRKYPPLPSLPSFFFLLTHPSPPLVFRIRNTISPKKRGSNSYSISQFSQKSIRRERRELRDGRMTEIIDDAPSLSSGFELGSTRPTGMTYCDCAG